MTLWLTILTAALLVGLIILAFIIEAHHRELEQLQSDHKSFLTVIQERVRKAEKEVTRIEEKQICDDSVLALETRRLRQEMDSIRPPDDPDGDLPVPEVHDHTMSPLWERLPLVQQIINDGHNVADVSTESTERTEISTTSNHLHIHTDPPTTRVTLDGTELLLDADEAISLTGVSSATDITRATFTLINPKVTIDSVERKP